MEQLWLGSGSRERLNSCWNGKMTGGSRGMGMRGLRWSKRTGFRARIYWHLEHLAKALPENLWVDQDVISLVSHQEAWWMWHPPLECQNADVCGRVWMCCWVTILLIMRKFRNWGKLSPTPICWQLRQAGCELPAIILSVSNSRNWVRTPMWNKHASRTWAKLEPFIN